MTYTEDQATFVRDIFKPPYLARMLEHTGRYTGRLSSEDRHALIAMALDYFWDLRDYIKTSNDVTRIFEEALHQAAMDRVRWRIKWNVYEHKWVRGYRLGRE